MLLRSPIQLATPPKRIISLVPSQTELLHYLGLESETTGITKFCVHPAGWFNTKTRVGGTKTIKTNIIHQLQPDLIIANIEENVKEQVEELAKNYPVWVTNVNNLEDALQMILDIGQLTKRENEAIKLSAEIKKQFDQLSGHCSLPTANRPLLPPTAYLIWRNPYMAAAGDTFINNMLEYCGFKNIFAGEKRYPQITVSQLQSNNCQLLLLSSEPYPFKQQHIDELQQQLPNTKILLVDGEMFSWYGSRLLLCTDYFKKLQQQCLP